MQTYIPFIREIMMVTYLGTYIGMDQPPRYFLLKMYPINSLLIDLN